MQSAPKNLLKEYVQSQQFTGTADIMQAVKEMFYDVIEQVMEVEMDDELSRERCQRSEGSTAPNYRNGYSKKTVKTQLGEVEIKVPRDRQRNYEPKIISKYDRNAEGMEEKILALYAYGMSQRGISEQIKELYGVEISPDLVTKISEKIMHEVAARQNRPLEIRKIIYTTNIIEGLNWQFRQITKTSRLLPMTIPCAGCCIWPRSGS